MPSVPYGRVYLVGAGPGDVGMLTLRARECLARADVVLHDRLVSPQVLALVRADAERVDRGPRRGPQRGQPLAGLTQQQINQLMIDRARAGKTVVRLKGGDPLVFGRGGEEAEALIAAGVTFEIVPGISSAIALPALAGIPLTHRDLASHVTIVSGHDAAAGPSVPWHQLAQSDTTLVLMMSLKTLAQNLEQLCAAGMPATTPAAVIERGASPQQRVITGTIGNLAARVQEARVEPPALTVVGQVVTLRERLHWIERRPLWGRRILVTRARHQAAALSEPLRELGAEPVEMPTIELVAPEDPTPLNAALQRLPTYDWILFTSANAVNMFFERLIGSRQDLRAIGTCRLAAIGPATANALHAWHLQADVQAADFRAEGLFDALRPLGIREKRFLLPRAAVARDELPRAIINAGGTIDVVTVYRAVAPPPDPAIVERLSAGEIDVVTFTSSSTAENFAALGLSPGRALVATIGPITRETCARLGFRVAIEPAQYTIAALVDAIVKHFSPNSV